MMCQSNPIEPPGEDPFYSCDLSLWYLELVVAASAAAAWIIS
jgi:hypothetical protein